MAFDGRRTMLSGLDVNANNGAGPSAPPAKSAMTASASRQSMIPRHSVAPARSELGGAVSFISRPSVAPSLGHGAHATSNADLSGWASQSIVTGTPHRSSLLHASTSRKGDASMAKARQSTMSNSGTAAGRMSMAAPTPSGRKSMARQSLAPRNVAGKAVVQNLDPRPIREDRALLSRMEAEIQEFLVYTSFVFPPKYSGEFHMPSQALVMGAFRHLYHQCIDLRYVFNAEPKKEIEEVLQLLGDIRYPMITELSKTKLSAPGSIHNWPPICGMLHWLVCLESSLDRVTTKYHGGPLERPVNAEDEEFCHYFPYLWRCYEQFWDSKDEYPEEQAKLEKIFDEKSEEARADVERMQRELEGLEEKVREYEENDSPLEIETKEKSVLESDVKKFVEYRDTVLLPRIQQYRNVIEKLKADADTHADLIEQRGQERDQLRKAVDAQDVSPDDFNAMSREREGLARQVEDVSNKLIERGTANGHTEVSLSNKQARVEDDLKTLSDHFREAGLFPFSLADGRQIFDFEMHAGNAKTMLPNGLDIGMDVRRKIAGTRDQVVQKHRETAGLKIREQQAYDLLLEEVEEKREEAEKMDMRLNSIREQTEMLNAASKEESKVQAELDARNELALAQIDQAGLAAVDQAEARLQAARVELNLVRERDAALRKQLHEEYVAGLENILSLKSTVTEGLQMLDDALRRCNDGRNVSGA